ncbi:hypothetical protein ACLOJK_041473 [Asimina triloba]
MEGARSNRKCLRLTSFVAVVGCWSPFPSVFEDAEENLIQGIKGIPLGWDTTVGIHLNRLSWPPTKFLVGQSMTTKIAVAPAPKIGQVAAIKIPVVPAPEIGQVTATKILIRPTPEMEKETHVATPEMKMVVTPEMKIAPGPEIGQTAVGQLLGVNGQPFNLSIEGLLAHIMG